VTVSITGVAARLEVVIVVTTPDAVKVFAARQRILETGVQAPQRAR
jgi:hypothetical protein